MQRIVIDTNVLVASLIHQSFPHLVVSLFFIDEDITWCISEEIMQEYREVLNRPKFTRYANFIANAESLLDDIEEHAIKFSPTIKLSIIGDDSDNKFLELAEECNAHFIITGNTRDFTMTSYKNTLIVSPKEYWEKHR